MRATALEFLDVDPERPTKNQFTEIGKCVKTFAKSRWSKDRNPDTGCELRVFKAALFQYWNKHRRLYKCSAR